MEVAAVELIASSPSPRAAALQGSESQEGGGDGRATWRPQGRDPDLNLDLDPDQTPGPKPRACIQLVELQMNQVVLIPRGEYRQWDLT